MGENLLLGHAGRFRRREGEPAHLQLIDWFTSWVAEHDIPDGTRVPSERDLAEALGVSRMTLRKALELLAGEGAIRRNAGSRIWTVARRQELAIDVSEFSSITAQLMASSDDVATRVVHTATRQADAAERELFALEPTGDTRVHEVHRVRVLEGDPVLFERSLLPAAIAPDLLQHDLTTSLYAILRDAFGHAPARATHRIRALTLSTVDAEQLAQRPGVAVLQLLRRTEDAQGRVIEASDDLIRSDRLAVSTSGAVTGE